MAQNQNVKHDPLKGTPEEKAKTLVGYATKRVKLSVDELKQLFSVDVEFIRSYTSVFKKLIDKDYRSNKLFHRTCSEMISCMLTMIADGNLTEKDREQIYICIHSMQDAIVDIEVTRMKLNHKLKVLIWITGTVGAVTTILTSLKMYLNYRDRRMNMDDVNSQSRSPKQ